MTSEAISIVSRMTAVTRSMSVFSHQSDGRSGDELEASKIGEDKLLISPSSVP